MTRKTTPKKRNPQDTTLRNIRAIKARVAKLEKAVRALASEVAIVGLLSGR